MASISKSKRNCDRISNLPDNVITHILSFLSTKDVVRTSILSTSWNQQWTLVPLIRFGEHFPFRIRCSRSFVTFVYKVLLCNVTSLDLFQFLDGGSYDPIDVSNWITVALSRRVRQIDVRATMPRRCRLPDCLCYSKTLVVLKLRGNFVFRVPKKISLESLRIFHYIVANFEDSESFSRLVSSCPVLEELQIMGHLKDNVKTVKLLNISSRVLKILILSDLYPIRQSENGNPHAYELVLDTPCLQYLEHKDNHGVPVRYHISTLHCLDTARLNLYLPYNLEDHGIEPLIPARSLIELIVAISKVRGLYVVQQALEVLYGAVLPNFQLPKFPNLIYLELGIIDSEAGFRLLKAFLQSSPQLESLYFYLDCSDETWDPPKDVPFCMLYNLKMIKVDSFHDLKPLPRVLTYFLEKTNCLEGLILHPVKKDEEFIKPLPRVLT